MRSFRPKASSFTSGGESSMKIDCNGTNAAARANATTSAAARVPASAPRPSRATATPAAPAAIAPAPMPSSSKVACPRLMTCTITARSFSIRSTPTAAR